MSIQPKNQCGRAPFPKEINRKEKLKKKNEASKEAEHGMANERTNVKIGKFV